MSQKVVKPAEQFPVARPWLKKKQQQLASLPLLMKAGILGGTDLKTSRKLLESIHNYGYSMASLLEMQSAKDGNKVAVHDDFGSASYDDLRDDARKLAQYLASKGVGEGDIVGILCRNSRFPIMALASMGYLGSSAILLNPASSPVQIEKILEEADSHVIISDKEFEDVMSSTSADIIVADALNAEEAKNRPFLKDIVLLDSASLPKLPKKPTQSPTVVCSSGTRGVPKAVVLPVTGDSHVLAGILKIIPWGPDLVVQQRATFFHAWGWLNLSLALSTGSTLVLRQEFSAKTDVDDCQKYNVNALVSAPPFIDALIDESITEQKPIGPFKFIVSSGNKIPAKLANKIVDNYGPVLYSFYGSTEHGQIAVADTAMLQEDSGIVGKTPVGVTIKVVKEDGSEAPTGEEGHVFSSNHMSMQGFLSEKDKVKLHDGLIDTGDLGWFDNKGRLHIAGRNDDMVIQGGENVHFGEINDSILDLDGISDVFVWAKQDGVFATIRAYVVQDGSKKLTDDDVIEHVRKNLSKNSVPSEIVWLDEIPKNDAGKVVPRELIEDL